VSGEFLPPPAVQNLGLERLKFDGTLWCLQQPSCPSFIKPIKHLFGPSYRQNKAGIGRLLHKSKNERKKKEGPLAVNSRLSKSAF
jgi:hypothetical protein